MQNVLFRLHQAVKDSPEPEGAETEEFARMLAEQPFWAESQDHESGGQIGLAFTQGKMMKNLCCSFICVMMAVMKHLQKSRKKWHPVSGNIPGCGARFYWD